MFHWRTVRISLLCALSVIPALCQTPREKAAIDLLQKGRTEEARTILLGLAKENPKNEPVNALLGQIAFGRNQWSEAAERFRVAPAFLAVNPLLLVNYAESLLHLKAASDALQVLNRLPAKDSVSQFEAGLLLARFEQLAAAEEHFQQAKAGYPEPKVLAYNLALVQYRSGKFTDSVATLEQLHKTAPGDADALNLLGNAYLDAGNTDAAKKVLEDASRRFPGDERNYVALGKLAIDEDLPAVGLEALDRGVERLPESYSLRMQRAFLRLGNSFYNEAETDYRKALQLQPNSPSPKIGLAFVLLQNQRPEEAAKLLESVLSAHPSFFPHYLMGQLLMRDGRSDEAMEQYRAAIKLEPRFAPSRTELGKLYLKKSDVPAAIQELEAALQADPDDTIAYYQLSMAYRRAGEKEKAQKALAQVKNLNQEQREMGTPRFLTRKLRKLRSGGPLPF